MSSFGTIVVFGAAVGLGAWWLMSRKSYFVERSGSHEYEYFSDLGEAKTYARKTGGALYELSGGGEYHGPSSGRRLTPNRSKRTKRRRRS